MSNCKEILSSIDKKLNNNVEEVIEHIKNRAKRSEIKEEDALDFNKNPFCDPEDIENNSFDLGVKFGLESALTILKEVTNESNSI